MAKVFEVLGHVDPGVMGSIFTVVNVYTVSYQGMSSYNTASDIQCYLQ